MKHLVFSFLIFSSLILTSCKWTEQTVLLVGDSWAAFTCVHKSMDKALRKAGLVQAQANKTCLLTTDPGARAEQWLQSNYHRNTLVSLKDPTVKVVYLSLGGNDVIKHWVKSLPPSQTEQIIIRTRQHIEKIVQVYNAERPDVKILVTGYDYPRFTEDHPVLAYRQAYEGMGSPQPRELNMALLKMSENFFALNQLPQTNYIHHLGLMHYYFGQKEAGLRPRTSRSPAEISKPGLTVNTWGGLLNYTSDIPAMQNYSDGEVVGVPDAFHLSQQGYDYLAEHSVNHYIKSFIINEELR